MDELTKDLSKDDGASAAPDKRALYLCNIKIGLLEDLETYVRCEVVCDDATELRKHRASHKGEKRFRCSACEYKTANGGHLKEHFRSKHTHVKPFTCPECNYATSRLSHLKQHMVKHSGEKPFACDHCTAKFARRSHLDVHLRTHTGEKPFHCEQCDYKCTEKGRLKRHVLCVHENPRFSCQHCEFKCSQAGMLNMHLSKEHGYCARCRREEQGLTGNKNWGAHTCAKRRQNTGFVLTTKPAVSRNVASVARNVSRSKSRDPGSNPLLQKNILRFEQNKRKLLMQEKFLKQLQKQQEQKERELQEKERQLREREVRLLNMAQQIGNVQNDGGHDNASFAKQKHKSNKKRKRAVSRQTS